MSGERLVFGLVPTEDGAGNDAGTTALVRWLSDRTGLHLIRRQAESYEALERLVRSGDVHVVWLPPLLFVRLESDGVVLPLVANHRADQGFIATIIVPASSSAKTLAELHGARMAWVDPLSTTGYVVPRLELAAMGIDPRAHFSSETFYGSHAAAARSLFQQSADAAATYARLDGDGGLHRGGWTDAGFDATSIRVLSASRPLPPDLIAVRADVAIPAQAALTRAFLAIDGDPAMRIVAKRVLGVDAFAPSRSESYEPLRRTIESAASSGIIEAAVVYLSTQPPPHE